MEQSPNKNTQIGKCISEENRKLAMHASVLSYFNYCPIDWHFCEKGDIHIIENIHERAIRVMTDDYVSDCATLLTYEDECTLYLKRVKLIVREVFKSLNCLNPGYACEDRPSH